jgi:hypothetical protein
VTRDWDDYLALRAAAERVAVAQAIAAPVPPALLPYEARVAAFERWLETEGYPLQPSPIVIRAGMAEGAGAVARHAIAVWTCVCVCVCARRRRASVPAQRWTKTSRGEAHRRGTRLR